MADSNRDAISPVGSLEDFVKEALLAVFQVTTQTIRTQICNLNHSGQLAIDEKRSLDNVLHTRP